jgi:hypothetical protein
MSTKNVTDEHKALALHYVNDLARNERLCPYISDRDAPRNCLGDKCMAAQTDFTQTSARLWCVALGTKSNPLEKRFDEMKTPADLSAEREERDRVKREAASP